MERPLNITFRNMDTSLAIESHIRERASELEKYHSRIVGCDVVIKAEKKKKVSGRNFEVQLTVRVPGPDIYVAREIGQGNASDDVNLAIHEAFDAARCLLKEQVRKMSGHDEKLHPPIIHGIVDRLFQGEGYGFLKADDGKEVYFEKDNLTVDDWKAISIDTKVRFRENIGDKGPYATNVTIVNAK